MSRTCSRLWYNGVIDQPVTRCTVLVNSWWNSLPRLAGNQRSRTSDSFCPCLLRLRFCYSLEDLISRWHSFIHFSVNEHNVAVVENRRVKDEGLSCTASHVPSETLEHLSCRRLLLFDVLRTWLKLVKRHGLDGQHPFQNVMSSEQWWHSYWYWQELHQLFCLHLFHRT